MLNKMNKLILRLSILFCLLSFSSCSYFQAKQLDGTWQYEFSTKIDGQDATFIGRYEFKNNSFSGGTFKKTEIIDVSFFKYGYEVEGTWDLTLSNLVLFFDLSTLNVEKDWLLSETDVESEIRKDLTNANMGNNAYPITELSSDYFKIQTVDVGSVKCKKVTETKASAISDFQSDDNDAYEYEDKFEELWVIGSNRLLTYNDINGLNKSDLRILRNYFYARLFYKFKSKDLSTFFSKYSWYQPRYSDVKYVEPEMSDIQIKNIQFIKGYE